MLAYRRRRWTNTESTLVQWLVFAGIKHIKDKHNKPLVQLGIYIYCVGIVHLHFVCLKNKNTYYSIQHNVSYNDGISRREYKIQVIQ